MAKRTRCLHSARRAAASAFVGPCSASPQITQWPQRRSSSSCQMDASTEAEAGYGEQGPSSLCRIWVGAQIQPRNAGASDRSGVGKHTKGDLALTSLGLAPLSPRITQLPERRTISSCQAGGRADGSRGGLWGTRAVLVPNLAGGSRVRVPFAEIQPQNAGGRDGYRLGKHTEGDLALTCFGPCSAKSGKHAVAAAAHHSSCQTDGSTEDVLVPNLVGGTRGRRGGGGFCLGSICRDSTTTRRRKGWIPSGQTH